MACTMGARRGATKTNASMIDVKELLVMARATMINWAIAMVSYGVEEWYGERRFGRKVRDYIGGLCWLKKVYSRL